MKILILSLLLQAGAHAESPADRFEKTARQDSRTAQEQAFQTYLTRMLTAIEAESRSTISGTPEYARGNPRFGATISPDVYACTASGLYCAAWPFSFTPDGLVLPRATCHPDAKCPQTQR